MDYVVIHVWQVCFKNSVYLNTIFQYGQDTILQYGQDTIQHNNKKIKPKIRF